MYYFETILKLFKYSVRINLFFVTFGTFFYDFRVNRKGKFVNEQYLQLTSLS